MNALVPLSYSLFMSLTSRHVTSSHLLWDMMAAMMKYMKRITVPRIPTLAGTKFFLLCLIL